MKKLQVMDALPVINCESCILGEGGQNLYKQVLHPFQRSLLKRCILLTCQMFHELRRAKTSFASWHLRLAGRYDLDTYRKGAVGNLVLLLRAEAMARDIAWQNWGGGMSCVPRPSQDRPQNNTRFSARQSRHMGASLNHGPHPDSSRRPFDFPLNPLLDLMSGSFVKKMGENKLASSGSD